MIIRIVTLFLMMILVQGVYAAACGDEPSTDNVTTCHATPDEYTITMYEMGLCTNINDQSATVPDISSNCQTTYTNSSGASILVQNNISSAITGGTSTRPANGSYTYGYIKVDARVLMKTTHTFSGSRLGTGVGAGNIGGDTCWTNGDPDGFNTTADCGPEETADAQNMRIDIINLAGAGPITNNVYNRFENDSEGLDDTYAWLIDEDGNASTSLVYSSGSGNVKYLLGVAKFSSAKTVTNSTSSMEAQFVVTRGLSISFPATNIVNFGINEFKVITTVY
jgi:hypothetical protein